MQLQSPTRAIEFETQDIYGEPFRLSDLRGERVMLCFFRDAACPFCNLRVYELTHRYTDWKAAGLRIVAVFSSPAEEVRAFVAKRPRPFTVISDPDLAIYREYGVQHSGKALLKALVFKWPRIVGGIATGGRPRPNPHVKLVPADFLVDEQGEVTDVWYGRNTSDHIPLDKVQAFAEAGVSQQARLLTQTQRSLAATEQRLSEARARSEELEQARAQLEAKLTELQQKHDTLSKILEAYKQGERF